MSCASVLEDTPTRDGRAGHHARMAASPWEQRLDRLIRSESLSEAQLATAEMMDVVFPGGSAVTSDGSEVVRAIATTPQLGSHPFRAYLLWILVLARRYVGVWRRAVEGGQADAVAIAEAQSEVRTIEELTLASDGVVEMIDDADPEVRSLVYRLIGSALRSPRRAADLLVSAFEGEQDDLARGCAAEALPIALARQWPEVSNAETAWIRGVMANGSPAIQGRMRHVLDGYAMIGVQDALKASDKKAGDFVSLRGLEGDAALLQYFRVKCETMESLLVMLAREIETLKKRDRPA